MQNNNQIFLSIVIPAYNEEINIVSTLQEIVGYLSGQNYTYEIVVVDDGSKDQTCGLVDNFIKSNNYIKLLKNTVNHGKGYVVRQGMLEAQGKYCLFMDADNSTKIKEIDKAIKALDSGYDVVIASRYIKGSRLDMPQPLTRIVLGKIYHFLSLVLIGVTVSDYNCGFKAYKNNVAKHIFSLQRMNGWAFDTELIFLINKFKYRLTEIPVNWQHKKTSKVKPIRDGIKSFFNLISIKVNEAKKLYT